ncbi:MAG: tyrosine-type recombinase/integrase [Motiliproteus sp.]
MPSKRYEHILIEFLTRIEVEALLAAPDQTTWFGRRDRTLLLLAVQTGLRVSELISLGCQDIVLGHGAYVRCLGKGRKTRCTPLRSDAVKALRQWLRERQGLLTDPLFPSQHGSSLSRDSIEYLVAKHVAKAAEHCPSLKLKHVYVVNDIVATAQQWISCSMGSIAPSLRCGSATNRSRLRRSTSTPAWR